MIGEIKMLNKIIKLFVTTKEVPAPTEQEKIQALLQALSEKGDKPSIRRTTTKWQGYGAEHTKLFFKVRNGHDVEYFGNPFWNMYRINSKVGTLDYVTHSVRR